MWASNQIPSTEHAGFIRDARDYALLNGLVLRYDHMTNDNCVGHMPFTLFPSPFPKKLYQQCLDIQPTVNKLMFKIANDAAFINEVLGPIAQVDDFTRNLLNINNTVKKEGLSQPITCCISRADYMLDVIPNSGGKLRARQVEVNAIASGMGAHSFDLRRLQEFLMCKYDIERPPSTSMPDNTALALVAGGLIEAFDAYGKSAASILLVNEPRSMNFSDQVKIEFAITRLRPDIKLVRKPFASLPSIVKLGPNKELLLEDATEIAVIYFRYGYDPSNYDFDGAWETRLLLERSRAIKCPSIDFHLSGAKKFQQVLNSQEKLERYLETEESKRLKDVFCKFWSFEDNSESDEARKVVASDSKRLVLKPQREGGGHNIFGEEVKPFVQRIIGTDERSQYILMEYIDGPREKNWLLLHTDDTRGDPTRMIKCDQLISELGIFGSILANSSTSEIKSNKSAGYLVRSKRYGVTEGGVASGYAGISNLILVDDNDYGMNNQHSLYYDKFVD